MGYKEEIFERIEKTKLYAKEDVLDWLRRDKKGNVVRNRTNKIVNLSKDISEPRVIEKDIEIVKTEKLLVEIKDRIEGVEISTAKPPLRDQASDKGFELKQERLIKKGKTTTFFRDQIKKAKSINIIDEILEDARSQLEGKSLESIEVASQIRKEQLGE